MLKVTIITVVYNQGETIAMTINSVLAQTYSNIEYIIIDGGSTDKTIDIIRQYEPMFHGEMHWISEPDQGIYDAMNKGIAMASGDIIGMLNADDFYSANDILEKVVTAFVEHEDIDGVYGDVHFVRPNNLTQTIRYYSSKSFTRSKMKFGLMPAHPSVYLKKDVYNRLGNFNIKYKIAADFDLLLRYIYIYHINLQYLNMDFITMRTGGVSTASLCNRIMIMKEHLQIFKDHGIKNNFLRLSLRYFSKIRELFPHFLY